MVITLSLSPIGQNTKKNKITELSLVTYLLLILKDLNSAQLLLWIAYDLLNAFSQLKNEESNNQITLKYVRI